MEVCCYNKTFKDRSKFGHGWYFNGNVLSVIVVNAVQMVCPDYLYRTGGGCIVIRVYSHITHYIARGSKNRLLPSLILLCMWCVCVCSPVQIRTWKYPFCLKLDLVTSFDDQTRVAD
jgi:hypothetical protein